MRGAFLPGGVRVLGHQYVAHGRLVADLARWDLHPQATVTDRFPLAETGLAYAASDAGTGGKVAVVMD